MLPQLKMHWVFLPLILAAGACEAEPGLPGSARAGTWPATPPGIGGPGHAGGSEADAALTSPGRLQGNWRVSRPGDPSDAAIMLMQLRHEGQAIEGDFVLFQPFCGLELPPVEAGSETCEFDGLAADLTGQVREGLATVDFRPGADGLAHRIIFKGALEAGDMDGAYLAPGHQPAIPVRLIRTPE